MKNWPGEVSIVKDPLTLSKIDFQKLTTPKIQNLTKEGRVSINQTVFFQVTDYSSLKASDLTIIPLEIFYEFEATWRPGIMMKYGRT